MSAIASEGKPTDVPRKDRTCLIVGIVLGVLCLLAVIAAVVVAVVVTTTAAAIAENATTGGGDSTTPGLTVKPPSPPPPLPPSADQPQDFSILSAYHGLDQLPLAASLLCGFNVAGDDGMPVVFSTQLQVDSVVPESFVVIRSDGESVVPNCATLDPANEPLEQRTVLLTGDFGTFGETPLRVEVTGPLLTFDGESLIGVSTEDITPLEDGPRVVLAERFAPDTNGLAGECPDGTAQVVQLTWEGGVTGPDGAALGEDQRLGTRVLLEDGATVNPLALVDDDPDNHVLACLAEDSPAQSVEVHAGLFHDPGDVANPATQVGVLDSILET